MIKNLKYFVQAIVVYVFFLIGRILGVSLGRKIFSFLFLRFGSIFKSKDVIIKNLEIFNHDLTKVEKEKIISNMWKNYGSTFIEYIFLKYLRKSSKNFKIIGKEIIENIILQRKPVIFVSGHFSNFELMSMQITKMNIPLATIYRPLNNIFLNPYMEYLRRKYVCKNQIKKGINGVRQAIDYLKNGSSIALMIDQRVSEGERIDFFGKSALTTTLPAQLAIKYNLNIIPVFIQRIEENNFEIKFFNPIYPSDYSNKLTLSVKLNETLEKMIRSNPNEWIWTHNRWK